MKEFTARIETLQAKLKEEKDKSTKTDLIQGDINLSVFLFYLWI